jgi:uncharacterized integral membrane protein
MKIFILFALLIAIVAVVFALQNSVPVLISFLGWQTQGSMALILLIAFSLGVLFGFLISVPPIIGRMRKISQLQRKVDEQGIDMENITRKLTETNTQLTTLQDLPPLPPEEQV